MFLCKMLILILHYGEIHVRVIPQVTQAWNLSICFTLCQLYAVEIMTCSVKRDTNIVMNVYE